jgi:hypothetical protein
VGLGHGHYRASEWPGITPSGSSGSAGRVVSPARCTGAKGARVDQRLPLVPLCVVPHVPTRPGAYTLLLQRVLLSRDRCREHVGARRTPRYGHAVPSRGLQRCPSCVRKSPAYGSILEGRGGHLACTLESSDGQRACRCVRRHLQKLRPELELDVHLHDHVDALYELIRIRALVQCAPIPSAAQCTRPLQNALRARARAALDRTTHAAHSSAPENVSESRIRCE